MKPISVRLKKFSSLILTIAVMLSVMTGSISAESIEETASGTRDITVFHTNDTHGRVYPDKNNSGMIGIDRIAAIKAATPNSILIDAGDTFHGLPIANTTTGKNIVDLMNLAKYDLMVPGNHDFNYGSARLIELAGMADFDIISANLRHNSDKSLLLPPTAIKTVDGITIGFFGLTTDETPTKTNPTNVDTIQFTDYKTEAQSAISQLKEQGADIIIGITHVSRSPYLESLAAELGADIDILIDGHDHLSTNEIVNGVLIAGSGEHGANLGKITLTIDAATNEITAKSAVLIPKADTESVTPVQAVTDAASGMMEVIDNMFEEKVGTSAVLFSSARGDETTPGVRTREMPLGNLVADAMRTIQKSDIAITNGGGLRADIKQGDITRGDLNSVLPFGNFIVVKTVTPAQLKAILENGVSILPVADGRFPQVSGLEYEYTLTQPAGQRILSISVGGKKIDLTDTATQYTLATNDFMANGGDSYSAIHALSTVTEGDSLDVVFEKYIADLCKNGASVTAPELGRSKELTQQDIDQRAAIDTVIEKIDQIPSTITLTDKKLITDARTAYDALTTEQKQLVTNIGKLTEAEAQISMLESGNTQQTTTGTTAETTASGTTTAGTTAGTTATAETTTAVSNDNPKTGDDTPMVSSIALLFISLGTLAIIAKKKLEWNKKIK